MIIIFNILFNLMFILNLPKSWLIRQLKNWTQEDMADKLDISTHAYK